MNAWAQTREVEKPKPFAARARKQAEKLTQLRDALQVLGHTESAAHVHGAIVLLQEAADRGVKGKDAAA